MGNTADLAVVQKTIIDTLHKEGKSQRVITERCGSSQSAVSKYIKCKVDWKEEIVKENVHKQQRWPQTWEYCQAKLIQTLGRASQGVNWSRSHRAQTSSGKGLPSHFWNRNIFRSQCEVSTVSDDLGCHVICWCWSTVFSEIHSQRSHLPGHFRARHNSFCWQAMEMLISFSCRTWHLPTLPKVPKACSMTKLAWPEPQVKSRGRWETPDRAMQMTWRPLAKQPGLYYTWAAPQADCLHATPHWCSNSCKRRPNQVLSA